MGARDIFTVLAVILAIATVAGLIASQKLKSGWLSWLAIPIVAWIWYWVLVAVFMGYYFLRANGVR